MDPTSTESKVTSAKFESTISTYRRWFPSSSKWKHEFNSTTRPHEFNSTTRPTGCKICFFQSFEMFKTLCYCFISQYSRCWRRKKRFVTISARTLIKRKLQCQISVDPTEVRSYVFCRYLREKCFSFLATHIHTFFFPLSLYFILSTLLTILFIIASPINDSVVFRRMKSIKETLRNVILL